MTFGRMDCLQHSWKCHFSQDCDKGKFTYKPSVSRKLEMQRNSHKFIALVSIFNKIQT